MLILLICIIYYFRHSAITLLQEAIESTRSFDPDTIRYKLYDTTSKTFYGELNVDVNNLMRNYYRLNYFKDDKEELLIYIDYYITRSPFSAFVLFFYLA